MLIGIAIAVAVAASSPPPSDEAEALGRRLAATGALATMLPAIGRQEIVELLAAHPELSPADHERLRTIAHEIGQADAARLIAALGHEYARTLSADDLKAMVAFNETPLAERYRAAVPGVTMRAIASVGKIDYKGDVITAFCKETGKLCPK